ncbi:hypothetical protein A5N15_01980 [Rothia kristinae]|uniref:Uncharacterized protein n=1 Tax=Rothia kristinae TaxID=37923 RepID=A0A657IVZ5_9MICC|nr:hypothetical protein A5N15_01980 [Rothia kristinae]
MNHLVNHYGHLLALSANSPFWQGHDTGYASQRAMIFQQIPTSGMPYLFQRWEEFEQYTRDLMDTGVIEEDSENRWTCARCRATAPWRCASATAPRPCRRSGPWRP